MTDELKPWTEEHLKSALVNLIEASKNSVRGPERSGSEQAASGIFKQIVAAWNARAPSVPEGWVLVPVEPTQEMLEAGVSAAPMVRADKPVRRESAVSCEEFAEMVAAMLAKVPKVTG